LANKPGDQPGVKKNLGEHCIKTGKLPFSPAAAAAAAVYITKLF